MGKLIIYQPDDKSTVSVKLEGNTVWLTQRQLSEILDTSTDNIGLHLKNIYATGELVQAATTEDFSVVQHYYNESCAFYDGDLRNRYDWKF